MIEFDNHRDFSLHNYPWQNSTIVEQSNANDSVCITVSPSQFRSLLPSNSDAVSFAHLILLFVREHIRSPRLVIFIADQIQKYNVAVFQHKNETRSLEIAIAQGQKIAGFFSEARNKISSNGSHDIQILCWADIVSSSNYNDRVEDIRKYISDNESQCDPLIDKVCDAYARARNPDKRWKKKQLLLLREYIIHELPALLHGIEYEGNRYTFMLHPTLKTDKCNGNDQREAMTMLLDYMRRYYVPNVINTTSMCHIFDVEVPLSLIKNSDEPLTDSSRSSFSQDDTDSDSSQNSEESSESISNTSNFLSLILVLQCVILIIHRFWIEIFSVIIFLYFFYFIHMLLIRWISKCGEWYSTSDGNRQQILGTKYQSFFGDLPAIQASQDGYFLNNLHINLNHPHVYRIWMGPEPALMLAHPQAIKDFWSQHDEKCVERNVHLGWPLEMLMGNGVGFRSISDRNRINKFFHNCFGSSQVHRFDAHLEQIVTHFFNQNSFDILQLKDIRYLAHDVAVHLFLGQAGFDHLNELHSLVDELRELMIKAFDARWTNLPVIGYYLLPTSYQLRNRIRQFNNRIRNVLVKIIDIYRQSSLMNDDRDDVNNKSISILAYFARDPNPTITFDELTDTIVEGLLAPNDGTAGTFMYTLLLLAMHPDIQVKAREEIQHCTDLTLKSLKDVSYLDQVLSECQRLFPIFMFNVPEFASKSMTISGINIPKNTMVMLDVVSLNHNQDAWAPDPLNFRPERFAAPVSPAQLKAYHGFGNGHIRRCLGQYLVRSLHRLFVAHLLNQKQIQLPANIKDINDIERYRLPFIYVPTQSVRLADL